MLRENVPGTAPESNTTFACATDNVIGNERIERDRLTFANEQTAVARIDSSGLNKIEQNRVSSLFFITLNEN